MSGRDGFEDDPKIGDGEGEIVEGWSISTPAHLRHDADPLDQYASAFESAVDLDAINALDDETVEKLIAILDRAEDRRTR